MTGGGERHLVFPSELPYYSDRFTMRQLDVLYGLSLGLGISDTGTELNLSPHTVKVHIRNISFVVGKGDEEHKVMMAMVSMIEAGLIPEEGIVTGEISDLTPREHEVLTLMAEGQSDRMIAGALEISSNTIRAYVRTIHIKLHAKDRFHAVAIGIVAGLVEKSPQI